MTAAMRANLARLATASTGERVIASTAPREAGRHKLQQVAAEVTRLGLLRKRCNLQNTSLPRPARCLRMLLFIALRVAQASSLHRAMKQASPPSATGRRRKLEVRGLFDFDHRRSTVATAVSPTYHRNCRVPDWVGGCVLTEFRRSFAPIGANYPAHPNQPYRT